MSGFFKNYRDFSKAIACILLSFLILVFGDALTKRGAQCKKSWGELFSVLKQSDL